VSYLGLQTQQVKVEDCMSKHYLQFVKKLSLLVTPFLACSVFAISPSRAATFASFEGELVFTNFSHNASETFANADINTISISKGGNGNVTTTADADGFLGTLPTSGFNSSSSLATGVNKDYQGFAVSEASLRGIFDIEENTLFSFDFVANLQMEASIDNSRGENAQAKGQLFFALLDIAQNSILDIFSIGGDLAVQRENDFFEHEQSDNVTLNYADYEFNFNDNQKLATVSAEGSLQRFFANRTSVALIGFKSSEVRVSAPEPSTCMALLFCGGVIGAAIKRKRQNTTLTYLLPKNDDA
jgi:hypothetical protein